MAESLENRFHQFVMSIEGTESIDALLAGRTLPNERRADYLLANRRAILELKTLKTDTSPKVEKEMDKYRERDEFPLIYGEVELQKILRHLPDGAEINKRIYRNITRSVEDALKSAEEQIENTAKLFELDGAVGLLVLLNEEVEILSPDVVAHKVSELLSRPRKDSVTSINFVWMLFESHVTGGAHPCIVLEGPITDRFPWFGEAIDKLQELWARFNRSPLVHSNVECITDLPFQSSSPDDMQPPTYLTRQEQWEQRYKAVPYLRTLSDDEVLVFGARAFKKLMPYFLKGGPRLPFEQLEPLLIEWSDFLQESRHRGLDLKHFHTRA